MTESTWITLGIAAIGFLIQGATYLTVRTRDLEQIKQSLIEKLAEEKLARAHELSKAVEERDNLLEKSRKDFEERQKSQDSSVGELGLSLRRHIEEVEREMHKIEIWGRDNYVQKKELESVHSDLKGLRSDIQDLISEIKKDFKDSIRELKGEIVGRA